MPVVRDKAQAKNFATKIQPNKLIEDVFCENFT
jgi:hypothetical protein